ncbi:hypothetical protein LWI28_009291 [Acer negundo]|uniref:Uncharacterized protein n=1 Tax=Acer negundo TaxID=4023 RepID=A0AAD5NKM9_ACENE|nr:hypothetical protein LWI28_009291 [Acer negundo]
MYDKTELININPFIADEPNDDVSSNTSDFNSRPPIIRQYSHRTLQQLASDAPPSDGSLSNSLNVTDPVPTHPRYPTRDLIGLPLLPTLEESFRGADVDRGVNYASAAAGILDESGKLLGERFNLRQQVENFRSTVGQLKKQMDETKMEEYLAKSLIIMNLGSNDYINNYLIPSFYNSSSKYNPIQYALLLITQYTTNIMELHNLGARKFLLAAIGPLGCMPNQLATRLAPPGKCVSFVNDMVEEFNKGLLSLVHQLNTNHTTSTFVFVNTYAAFTDILNNPDFYGFSVTDRGCCGIGRNKGQITCLPFSIPCLNRDEFIFWDAYHPTQAFNQIIAEKAFNGGLSVCYPMNVKQMAQARELQLPPLPATIAGISGVIVRYHRA